MEIERKYLIKEIPFSLEAYPYKELEQGYISTSPVIRIRKADEQYILTVKSSGLLERQEFELPMNEADYKRIRRTPYFPYSTQGSRPSQPSRLIQYLMFSYLCFYFINPNKSFKASLIDGWVNIESRRNV